MNNFQPINYETNPNLSESTPRYGPLPTLARPAIGLGSAPLHRRLRVPPPPAYSDLDEFESDRAEDTEPRYQPMPLHSISRRPLPSQPHNNNLSDHFTKRKTSIQQLKNSTKNRSTSSSSNESVEGDYEDISQL